MKVHNTLTRTLDEIHPLSDNKISLYTCGLTVYSQPHIGNWVAYIYWDVLVRNLKDAGFDVTRVQNITDVGHLTSDEDAGEDKMLKGALREGLTAWQVAEKYIAIADDEAYTKLGLLRPDHMPRATDYIPQQIAFVQELEAKGFTYTIDDGVYFDTSKLADYGKLAQLDIAGLQFGARVADSGKKNPTDFAVWKFSNPAEKRDMEWWAPFVNPNNTSNEKYPSGYSRALDADAAQEDREQRTEPYTKYGEGSGAVDAAAMRREAAGVVGSAGQLGEPVHGSWGFPGWHLECSVMAREIFGDQIDIHTGGIDHIPVHHTNEIAQTEAVTGKPFSTYWMHANHIKVNGEKMSKSLGNIYTLQDITDKGFDMQAFKLMVLSKQYRTEGNFTWNILEAAQSRLEGYHAMADQQWQGTDNDDAVTDTQITETQEAMRSALQTDLNTPAALVSLSQLETLIDTSGIRATSLGAFKQFLEWIDVVLGFTLSQRPNITDDQQILIKQRQEARDDKNWELSDRYRDQLLEQGIVIQDTARGQIWSKK